MIVTISISPSDTLLRCNTCDPSTHGASSLNSLLQYGSHKTSGNCRWKPKVRTISSANGVGIEQLWADALLFRQRGLAGIKDMRGQQRGYSPTPAMRTVFCTVFRYEFNGANRYWMWQEACGMLERSLKTSPHVRSGIAFSQRLFVTFYQVQKRAQELQVGNL
jgi:hypothetical protein